MRYQSAVLTDLARTSPRPATVISYGAVQSTPGADSTATGARAYTSRLIPRTVGAMLEEAYPFMLAAVAKHT